VNNWTAQIRVTLKPAVNDPQGLAIRGGLHQLGFGDVSSVRAGKFFDVHFSAPDRAAAEQQVSDMCRRVLANTVIEDYSFEVRESVEVAR